MAHKLYGLPKIRERENIKIAQKIYELKPYLQVQDMEERFREQRRIGQSIRKIVQQKKFMPPKLLPPLNAAGDHDPEGVLQAKLLRV